MNVRIEGYTKIPCTRKITATSEPRNAGVVDAAQLVLINFFAIESFKDVARQADIRSFLVTCAGP